MVLSGREREMFVVGVSSFTYTLLKLEDCPWHADPSLTVICALLRDCLISELASAQHPFIGAYVICC
jgi:hypothetical protein